MSNPLVGRRAVWLRQVGDTGEGTIAGILHTMTTIGGFDCLCLKVADGVTWQGDIDSKTPITDYNSLGAVGAACSAAGVEFCPVVVPRGHTDRAEAEFHAQLAATWGSLIIDIEPGDGYWDKSPYGLVPAYFKTLRASAPDAYLCAQPDPRPGATAAIPLAPIAPYVDAFAAQHYVGFDAGWSDVALEVQRVQAIKALGRDMFVTLWGLGDLNVAGRFWAAVQPIVLGFQVFAFGSMNADQLNWAATLTSPVQPQPPAPVFTNDDLAQAGHLLFRLDPLGNAWPDWVGLHDYAARFVP